MKEIDAHSIQKVSVDIYSKSVKSARAIEKNISTFIQDNIMPLIASYLDELEKELPTESIQIPQINISLDLLEEDFLDPDTIQHVFMNQFKEVLSREISSQGLFNFKRTSNYGLTSNSGLNSLSSPNDDKDEILVLDTLESTLKSWVYFLEKGNLPWWYSEEKARDTFNWEKIEPLVSRYLSDGKLLKYFQHTPFLDRLINQYSVEDLGELVWMVIARKSLIQKLQYLQVNEKLDNQKKLIFYRLIIAISFFEDLDSGRAILFQLYFSKVDMGDRKKVEEIFREVIKFDDINERKKIAPLIVQILEVKEQLFQEIPKDIREHSKKIEMDSTDSNEGYYVSKAGLILLHPFLKPFFIDCEVMDEKGEIIDAELAVHALYYLATKEEKPFDFELVFEKYLVGLPINQTVSREIILTAAIKDNTEKLLHALKVNWKRLGNTGLETIRNEFINRKGKLVFEENSDRLFVERKAQDVLLDAIPWNLSLIKLPWQKKHLLVDW